MAKKVDPKAKAKKQKMIAIVGGVLLLGLMAFQVPRTMKMLNAKPPPQPVPVAAPTAVPTSDPSILPTPGTAVGAATPAPSGGGTGSLISSDIAPAPQAGQLIAFGRFSSKDPFKQQVDPDALQTGGTGDSGGTGSTPGSSPSTPGSQPATGGGGGGVVQPTVPGGSTPSAPAGSAVISVNGTEEKVAVKADFPKDQPVFTLVSLTGGVAKVAIAGGAFASGAPTVTLKKGTAVTLVNTADGSRYELKLVSLG
jgi:hypothetical protein